MKTYPANRFWKVALLLVLIGFFATVFVSHADNRGPQLVAETRQTLHQQGFKTDLADFDFSTSPELRAREGILKAAVPDRNSGPSPDQINLMETVGTNSAIVLWKQDSLKLQYQTWPENTDEMSWNSLGQMLNQNQSPLDAACVAAMAGPIAFNLNASAGGAMLLPHLAVLKNLTQTLGCRVLLALHDGNQAAAWTNLMAATRLVTAWEPEPAEISHLVRFGDAKLVFNITWQALQTNGWSDEQLAQLQQQWQSVNFFTNLPETAAFKRASDAAFYEQDRHEVLESRPPFKEFITTALQFPQDLCFELQRRWGQNEYLRGGMYEDEKDLLLFYRDREVELRNAIQAPTWMQMRQLPGVTNNVFFLSKYPSRIQSMLNLRENTLALLKQGTPLLGHAAEAQARRRILITTIALERFREKNGVYPNALSELAPEFVKALLPDFMDGQPLRYRLMDEGHFLLYSVGLDCMDDGGKFPTRLQGVEDWQVRMGNAHLQGTEYPLAIAGIGGKRGCATETGIEGKRAKSRCAD